MQTPLEQILPPGQMRVVSHGRHVPLVQTCPFGQIVPFVQAELEELEMELKLELELELTDEELDEETHIPFVVHVLPVGHECVVSHGTHTPLEQTCALHWFELVQVPHVPLTHACPLGHWAVYTHVPHVPFTHP